MKEFVTCEICKKQLKKINNWHLRRVHNLTTEEYKKMYLSSEIISELCLENISKGVKNSEKFYKTIRTKKYKENLSIAIKNSEKHKKAMQNLELKEKRRMHSSRTFEVQ